MDLMVMENIFFQRTILRVYDLKGSVRSRYNSATSSHNKVLLDSNLIEEQHTKPIFVGSKAKQRLERAVWNDTSVLAVCNSPNLPSLSLPNFKHPYEILKYNIVSSNLVDLNLPSKILMLTSLFS